MLILAADDDKFELQKRLNTLVSARIVPSLKSFEVRYFSVIKYRYGKLGGRKGIWPVKN